MITNEELDQVMADFLNETRASNKPTTRPAPPRITVDTKVVKTERTTLALDRNRTVRTENSNANPNNSYFG